MSLIEKISKKQFNYLSYDNFNQNLFITQEKDWEDAVLPYAEEHGCTTFGAIGTCWGSYMVVRMAAHPKMLAGVSMHPSHSPIMQNLGENEEEILNEIQVHQCTLFW